VATGLAVLIVGFAALSVANFITDQFARSATLGWISTACAAAGAGLMGWGVLREVIGLARLAGVDHLRARLANPATTRAAALTWLGELPDPDPVLGAIRAANDPDAVLALLRAGPGARLRAEAEAIGRRAAVDVFALTAAMPSPALDAALVAWRGLRLLREVAALYGMRPGVFGTFALLRRTLSSAASVAAANVAVDTVVRAVLSHPMLAQLAGDAAGAGVAARRMIVLARAAGSACSPLGDDTMGPRHRQ
jgi:putative membrane protein